MSIHCLSFIFYISHIFVQLTVTGNRRVLECTTKVKKVSVWNYIAPHVKVSLV